MLWIESWISRRIFFETRYEWYEWKTFFRTTVSIPPLLGQPYKIQPCSPRANNENTQAMMMDRTSYVLVVAV